MANFIISELAKKDITDIWNYTASEWSEEQAIRYFEPIAHFDISKVARRPQYRRTLERVEVKVSTSSAVSTA